MFSQAIVRRPARSMVEGITSAPDLGKPDYEKALAQHDAYIEALEDCGVVVSVLEADEAYPDSCFVEDTAVLTRKCAVIDRPGARSRQGEEGSWSRSSAASIPTTASRASWSPARWKAATS